MMQADLSLVLSWLLLSIPCSAEQRDGDQDSYSDPGSISYRFAFALSYFNNKTYINKSNDNLNLKEKNIFFTNLLR